MKEWCKTQLGELTELITKGTTPSEKDGGFSESGINYIKSDAVSYAGRIDPSKFVYISEAVHEKFKRSQLKESDILFSMAGAFLGKTGIVEKGMLPANTNQANAIIRLDRTKAQTRFISYFLRQESVIDFVNNMSGQSAQPNINFQEIKSIEIDLPSVEEQKTIAAVLSSLDDKIDLLHRQNQTLEAMAATLFRQWFVEEAGEDWEEKSLLDLIELVGGGTPKTSIPEYWNGDIPWLAGGDIATNHKGFVSSSEKTITKVGLDNSSAKLLPKFATVISARGTVGKYCLLAGEMAFSQSNYGILPKIKDSYFFTYLLVNHMVEELQSAAYGSVFDTITTSTFRDAKFAVPPVDNVLEFEGFIVQYFDKKLLNQSQIRTLETLRDTLLPKLMSGAVRVALDEEAA